MGCWAKKREEGVTLASWARASSVPVIFLVLVVSINIWAGWGGGLVN